MGFLDNLFSGGGGFLGFRPDVTSVYQRNQQQEQVAQQSLLSALEQSGVPRPMALGAVLNPDLLKQIAPEYFGGYKLVETGNNPITGPQKMMQGPGGKLYPLEQFTQGQPTGGGLGGGGLLAKGVSQLNSELSGEDYLKQFGPEVQAAVKAYMNGDVLPTGNARNQNIATTAKTIAQKVGQDLGIPVSDSAYSEKRKMRMELGSVGTNTLGGQTKAFNQATNHLDSVATKLLGLGNWDGPGGYFPVIGHGVNTARQQLTSEQKSLANEVAGLVHSLAGEVNKLFSGSQGGGVHEREITRERFQTTGTPKELAASLEATLELMNGGLNALQSRVNNTFGPNNNIKLVDDETKKRIERIQEVIAKLKKGGEPAPKADAAPALSGGFKYLGSR